MSTTLSESFLALQGVEVDDFNLALANIDQTIEVALERIRDVWSKVDCARVYVGHSGGKDSVVVQTLFDLAIPGHLGLTVHTPKPGVTHPKTVQFLYALKRRVIYCPANMHNLLDLQTQIDGTRIAEYNRTDGRSTNLVVDGKEVSRENMTHFVEKGLFGLSFLYPIYDWSDAQVWACIQHLSIPFSDEYYELSTPMTSAGGTGE